jgi:4'-phosphopantetheinyl transferase
LNGIKNLGFDTKQINEIKYTLSQKPFIEGVQVDFNITHSGNYVLCALSIKSAIGIDIEEIRSINIEDFKDIFAAQEWNSLISSPHPEPEFFRLWTRKESIAKADGKGITLELNEIDVLSDSVLLNNKTWYLKEIQIDNQYKTCIASDLREPFYDLKKISF